MNTMKLYGTNKFNKNNFFNRINSEKAQVEKISIAKQILAEAMAKKEAFNETAEKKSTISNIRKSVCALANKIRGKIKDLSKAFKKAWAIIKGQTVKSKVAGVSFNQKALQRLTRYNPADVNVELIRENNEHDVNAVSLSRLTRLNTGPSVETQFLPYHFAANSVLEIFFSSTTVGIVINTDENVIASTTRRGIVQLATDAEAQAGTATNLAVTPAGMKSAMGTIPGTAVSGYYMGNGNATQTITLGFTPTAIFILNGGYSLLNPGSTTFYEGGLAVTANGVGFSSSLSPNPVGQVITITTNGFIVYLSSVGFNAATTNRSNVIYNYVAWR